MSESQGPQTDEALTRFDTRYDALVASQRREPKRADMESGAGAGYKLIGELVGGVLTGLGLGWVLDRFAGTAPWGLIAGMLIGTGAAIFMVVRSAGRMSAGAQTGPLSPATEPLDDKDGAL